MSLADIIVKMPWWYLLALILFSLYYAIRGVMEQRIQTPSSPPLSKTERVIIRYVQEFIFKVVFTASGFIALFIANFIFSSLESVSEIEAGTAILLIFLFIWGITGVSGYLTFLVITGRFPGGK
jgi:hypothetical protein